MFTVNGSLLSYCCKSRAERHSLLGSVTLKGVEFLNHTSGTPYNNRQTTTSASPMCAMMGEKENTENVCHVRYAASFPRSNVTVRQTLGFSNKIKLLLRFRLGKWFYCCRKPRKTYNVIIVCVLMASSYRSRQASDSSQIQTGKACLLGFCLQTNYERRGGTLLSRACYDAI